MEKTIVTTDSTTPRIEYADPSARYVGHFIISTTADEVMLDCASGLIRDSQTGKPVIPVHTRLALSYGSAQRLIQLLKQAVNSPPSRDEHSPSAQAVKKNAQEARLPKVRE